MNKKIKNWEEEWDKNFKGKVDAYDKEMKKYNEILAELITIPYKQFISELVNEILDEIEENREEFCEEFGDCGCPGHLYPNGNNPQNILEQIRNYFK